ncbi:alkylation response protein AidB-like acyl-CoA dehydrogenase [Kitasatospora sp. MAP12-15]|uniref:acyl-CoA dehydrogenase n=1 Tax=unclassified Kitasatospora TaxID=2633591 RepID=UPI002473DC4C|nr:acyl-CoA dehydrogenase [Kitasatospora sp. MAP12-44]MDH6113782.1 alkylation response protein AidB-like acyl-CoA dehydrogenase [Kitasatospora sp. MAP12-44]
MTLTDHRPAPGELWNHDDRDHDDPDRVEPLEALFGDPDDPGNPTGFTAFLDADERGQLLPAGRSLLDTYRIGAEFVPARHGGRLRQADHLARTLRAVFRRDAALGLGHGAINLIASATVWAAGAPQQRQALADVLLNGGQCAGAYTELGSGHDLTRSKVTATRSGAGFALSGRKEVINNVNRADTVTVLARTGDGSGSRDHSLLLLDMRAVPRETLRFLPRYRTSGLRAIHLGGVEFLDCPVPESAVVGEVGGALETVLRAFQVTKATLTGATIGCFDTQLRTATRFAVERRLYHRSVSELPHARSVLAGAFADLLISDSLSTVVCRALHVLPGQSAVLAPAAKYLVPLLIQESVDSLAVVLGARSFLREGRYGIFQKHLRDLPVASLAHSGATVCQATVIPQLPRLARRSWLASDGAPATLFRLREPLPELDFGALGISAGAEDSLLGTLPVLAEELRGDAELGPLCELLVAELRALRASCADLAPRNRTPLAEPIGFQLAERYSILLAAAACLGVWRYNHQHPTAFLRDSAWLTLALRRLIARLGLPLPPAGAGTEQRVFTELLSRERENRSFDLTGRLLA